MINLPDPFEIRGVWQEIRGNCKTYLKHDIWVSDGEDVEDYYCYKQEPWEAIMSEGQIPRYWMMPNKPITDENRHIKPLPPLFDEIEIAKRLTQKQQVIETYKSMRALLWGKYQTFYEDRAANKLDQREALSNYKFMESIFSEIYPDFFDEDNCLERKYADANKRRRLDQNLIRGSKNLESGFYEQEKLDIADREKRYQEEIIEIEKNHPEGFIK